MSCEKGFDKFRISFDKEWFRPTILGMIKYDNNTQPAKLQKNQCGGVYF